MSDEEWELPVPREDPEIYKAGAPRVGGGPARLVPKDDSVEGGMEDERGKGPPSCPFSGA